MNIKDLENIKKQITTTYKNNLKYNSLKRLCNKYNKLIVKLEDNEIEIIKELEKINFESVNKKELVKLGLTQLILKAKNKLLNIFIKEEINKLISLNNNPKDKEIIEEELKIINIKINKLTEDKKDYLYQLEEEQETLEALERDNENLEKLIIDCKVEEKEEIKEEMYYNEKYLKQSKEALELLKMNIALIDIELKRFEYEKKNIDR